MQLNVALDVRPIGLDDLSTVRHVHTLAYRAFAGPSLAEDQIDALVEHVRSTEYSQQIVASDTMGAWIDGRLVGTAGWTPGSNLGVGAKLTGVCVDPLFGGIGIGRKLVEAAESRARRAGFTIVTARTPANAVRFFERLGYLSTSQGVWATPSGVTVPVFHMRKGEERTVRPVEHPIVVSTQLENAAMVSRLH